MMPVEDCTDIQKYDIVELVTFLPNDSAFRGLKMLRDHVRFLRFAIFPIEKSSYFFFFKHWSSDIEMRYKSQYTRQIFKSLSFFQD